MTGWRVGWLVLPEPLIRAAERIGQSLYISAPELSQVAAAAAMDAHEEIALVRDGYVANREILMRRLPQLGFSAIAPIDGAFYAYASVPEGVGTATHFARTLLATCHVALTPGDDFDVRRGEHFVRLSYACGTDALIEATDRIAGHLGR